MAKPEARGSEALRISAFELERMAAAAATLRGLEAPPRGIVATVTGGAAVADWRHYPEGEVYDPATHAQYFYHAHPAQDRPPREHGHFHLFLRAEGMPAGARPLLLPELAVAEAPMRAPQAAPAKRGGRDEVSHIVAIGVDERGELRRLFTTNRWVTGETWYPAEDVIAMLDRFDLSDALPPTAADRWLVAVVRLFRPQIAALLRARDEAVMAWRRRRRTHVLEDPRLEIPSSLEVDLAAQLRFVEAAAGRPQPRRAAELPGLAEGWGDGP